MAAREELAEVDVSRAESVEREFDRLIDKRHDQRRQSKGERAREQLWVESVRRFYARQSEDLRTAWYEHEMRLYRIHSGLASEHLKNAEKYRPNGIHEEST